ncbi:hypothetical protein [Cellulosimicrobium aquatile]|uniref:hypothetical protein n=1 Tax=Cellulosimicrobium aquatile TaxID=1612203 RepID=UPI00145993C4|nr:hypothetical protein [Cellulosimicrobium aquatile]NMF29600.1 hypothetical protein [Cellulosimicrobium aquatile]
MAVTVQKLDNNGHTDGEKSYPAANQISVHDGVLYVQQRAVGGGTNLAIYQSGFWISADVTD